MSSKANPFLVAVTLVFRNELSADCGIPFKYRLDGSIFNLRRLQAQTKVSTDTVHCELQYAGDTALPSHTHRESSTQLECSRRHLSEGRADHQYKEYGDSVVRDLIHRLPRSCISQYMVGDTLNTILSSSLTSAASSHLT